MYKVICSGVFEGEAFETETKPVRTRFRARRMMRRLVREAEEANGYRLPEYGGEDDCEKSIRVSRDIHVYEFNDCSGDYLQWEVVAA